MLVRLKRVKDKDGKDTSAFVDQILHLTLRENRVDDLTGEKVLAEQKYIFAGEMTHLKNFPPDAKIVTQIEIPDTDLVACRDFAAKCRVGTRKVRVRGDDGKIRIKEVPDYNQLGKWLECVDIPEKVKKNLGL